MAKKSRDVQTPSGDRASVSAQPRLHQHAAEIQAYGTVSHMLPLELEEPVRLEMTEQLNLLLADTMTLRDLYKKSHWQVAGPTFYQLHLLFGKHRAYADGFDTRESHIRRQVAFRKLTRCWLTISGCSS